MHFKNGYKRQIDETWIPFDKAVFGIVREFSSRQYADNYDSGSFDETFYLQAGGKTRPSQNFTQETILQKPMLPEPDTLPVSCYLNSVTEKEIIWEIPSGSVPQFQYIIKIDGEFYKQGFNSEVRMCRIDCGIDESIELLIEDLYGKISRIKYLVREGREVELRMTKSAKLLLAQKSLLEEEEDWYDDIPDDGATDAETLITGVTTPFRGQSAGATTLFTTDYESEVDVPVTEHAVSEGGELTDRSSLRGATRTSATMETAMFPPSPERQYLPSGKGRSKTAVTLETPMFPYSSDGQSRPSRRARPQTQATTDTALYPSSAVPPSTHATSAKSKTRTQFTVDTEMYPTTSGADSPYPSSEKGKAKTYQTIDTAMYPTSDDEVSEYPASERGVPKTYLTTDTGAYPSSAGGTLYPASEVGDTTVYATSVDDNKTDGETVGGYNTDIETIKYNTTEGETTDFNPTTDYDDESVY